MMARSSIISVAFCSQSYQSETRDHALDGEARLSSKTIAFNDLHIIHCRSDLDGGVMKRHKHGDILCVTATSAVTAQRNLLR